MLHVHEVREAVEIMAMDGPSFKARLKLEKLLGRAQREQCEENWISLGIAYNSSATQKQLKTLVKFMAFDRARRMMMLRECFNGWCIVKLELTLRRQEEEVVGGKYFQQASRRETLRRCFEGWAMMMRK